MDFKSFFLNYFKKCLEENKTINIQDMRDMSIGHEKSANTAFKELWDEGIITGTQSLNVFEPGIKLENFNSISLTKRGIEYINKREIAKNPTEYLSNINSALKAYQLSLNNIPLELKNACSARQLSELHNHLPHIPKYLFDTPGSFSPDQVREIIGMYSNFPKQLEKICGHKHKKILQNYLDTVENARVILSESLKQLPPAFLPEKAIKKLDEKEDTSEQYTFEGILGQNCGEVVPSTSEDIKRIQEKGFKVENGIKVLRGYASSKVLASFSQKDENYQREENSEHLESIRNFVKNIRTSAKYLPEITLIARGYIQLQRAKFSGSLSDKQNGELENLEYYKLTVSNTQLIRIDGNHRLEALKDENYYIPFSIIIWEDDKINFDDESFLFYFLNSKAKKLTTEENLKGLVKAKTWTDAELIEANKYLPHLRYLGNEIQNNRFISSYFRDHEPIKNIVEILDKINEEIDIKTFQEVLSLTNELLILDNWKELRRFKFYAQLVFYVVYKNYKKGDIYKREDCVSILDNINNWVKKYKFDHTTFDNPIMLYKSAEKTNNTQPIKVFVAMPYYDDEIIEDINDQLKKLSDELINKYPLLANRFEIYEVMRHRGYAIDVQKQIVDQIRTASIFIADISEHMCKKNGKKLNSHANPNVMYELGLAKGQSNTEIILLKNKKDKIPVPSDIITKYHNKFEFDKKYAMRKKLFEAIESILKDKFNLI